MRVFIFLLANSQSKCQAERNTASNRGPLVGVFVPKCKNDGSYEERQCHGSTGYCWCVNEITGEEIAGTKQRRGQYVNCSGMYDTHSTCNIWYLPVTVYIFLKKISLGEKLKILVVEINPLGIISHPLVKMNSNLGEFAERFSTHFLRMFVLQIIQ